MPPCEQTAFFPSHNHLIRKDEAQSWPALTILHQKMNISTLSHDNTKVRGKQSLYYFKTDFSIWIFNQNIFCFSDTFLHKLVPLSTEFSPSPAPLPHFLWTYLGQSSKETSWLYGFLLLESSFLLLLLFWKSHLYLLFFSLIWHLLLSLLHLGTYLGFARCDY